MFFFQRYTAPVKIRLKFKWVAFTVHCKMFLCCTADRSLICVIISNLPSIPSVRFFKIMYYEFWKKNIELDIDRSICLKNEMKKIKKKKLKIALWERNLPFWDWLRFFVFVYTFFLGGGATWLFRGIKSTLSDKDNVNPRCTDM